MMNTPTAPGVTTVTFDLPAGATLQKTTVTDDEGTVTGWTIDTPDEPLTLEQLGAITNYLTAFVQVEQ